MTNRHFIEIEAFGDSDVLRMNEGPMPVPGPGELLVEVHGAGVNFADAMVRRGEYRRDQPLPDVLGMEAAGIVVLAGPATTIRPGTPVAVFLERGGGYATHVVTREELTFPIIGALESDLVTVAAAFLQGVTAWYAVRRYAHLSPHDSVLVSGAAGGVGSWSVQLAAEMGVSVAALASTSEKRASVLALGATAAFDSRDPELSIRLREFAPSGFNAVLDGVGGPLFDTLLRSLAKNGSYVVVGSASQEPALLDTRHLLPRGQSVSGFVVRNVIDSDPAEPAEALLQVLGRVADGRIRMNVHVFPLSGAAQAHRLLEDRSFTGKLVLDPRL